MLKNAGHLYNLSSYKPWQKKRPNGIKRPRFQSIAAFCLFFFCLLSCDRGLDSGPVDQPGIKGTLIFNDPWPANTADVAVAVYRTLPKNLADFFNIAGWDTTVAIGATRYEYDVPLESAGTYAWVVVAWRPENGFWNFTSLLGCYHIKNSKLPTPVEVVAGETAKNIDIQAYFSLIEGANLPDREICSGFLPDLPALPGKPGVGR